MQISEQLVKGTIEPIILALVAERPMYGYELIKLVNKRTDNALQWREGTVYPWLHRLEGDGLIRSDWQGEEGTRRRKYYRITRRGLKTLAARKQEWSTLVTAVDILLAGSAAV